MKITTNERSTLALVSTFVAAFAGLSTVHVAALTYWAREMVRGVEAEALPLSMLPHEAQEALRLLPAGQWFQLEGGLRVGLEVRASNPYAYAERNPESGARCERGCCTRAPWAK